MALRRLCQGRPHQVTRRPSLPSKRRNSLWSRLCHVRSSNHTPRRPPSLSAVLSIRRRYDRLAEPRGRAAAAPPFAELRWVAERQSGLLDLDNPKDKVVRTTSRAKAEERLRMVHFFLQKHLISPDLT